MAGLGQLREKYIYFAVVALLLLVAYVFALFHTGAVDYQAARIYIETLVAIATLALLYFAYFNVTSRKQEDAAHLELAVRPILVWELEAKGSGARIAYKALKHPIYDFRATLRAGGRPLVLEERHLDVSDANSEAERARDVTGFVRGALGSSGSRTLELEFAYHSEAGGKYLLNFTKEAARRGNGFSFGHRKFVSAKYPWRAEKVQFDGE
jgi:hypothetical protein